MSKQLEARLKSANKLLQWCLKSEQAPRINAALDLMRSEDGIPILPEQLDRDPYLLNCSNGTLDLRTGKLREHWREDCLTKLCPTAYDEDATCPNWQRFLDGVFLGSKELIDFVRRLLGYCLTGDVREQVFAIFHGGGGNGKSTLVTTMAGVMGSDYQMKASAAMFMTRRGERHPTEIADLFGKRLVIASEPEQGCRLNESLVKDLTGGEPIRARRMKEDFWEFPPTHKVVLLTNHKPRITGTDDGIWRRVRLIPFEARFIKPDEPGFDSAGAERRADTGLLDRLAVEHAGILTWLVSGCLDWQRHGLPLPEKVKAATQGYRAGEDTFAQWLEDSCTVRPQFCARAAALFKSFAAACEQAGEDVPRQRAFGELLCAQGYQRYTNNGTWYRGIGLRQDKSDSAE